MPTHYSGTTIEMRTLDAFIKLTRCTNSLFARLSDCNSVGDLTHSQFAVLESLYHIGSMTQGEISAKVLKSGSNLTTVVDNLERDGFVRRERCVDDRRVVHVHLTESGRKKVEAVLPGHIAALVSEFSVLDENELIIFAGLCKKLGTGKEGQK